MPALQIGWAASARTIWINGHTIQVGSGGTTRRGNDQFQLRQFHFHHPSEHPTDSNRYPMEVRFVHARQPQPLKARAVQVSS